MFYHECELAGTLVTLSYVLLVSWGIITYGVKMTMSFAFHFPHLHTVISVQIQQYPFQLRYLPEPRLMDFRQPVDGFDPGSRFLELFVAHHIAFIDDDYIRMRDLQVRGR